VARFEGPGTFLFQYNFEEGIGTVAHDSSGSGNDATLGLSGSFLPTWVSGGGLNFNDALLQIPPSLRTSLRAIYVLQDIQPYSTYTPVGEPTIFSSDNNGYGILPSSQPYQGDQSAGHGFGTSQSIQGTNGLLWVLDVTNGIQHIYYNGFEVVSYMSPDPAPIDPGTVTEFWLNFFASVGLPNTTVSQLCWGFSTVPDAAQAMLIHNMALQVISGRSGVVVGNTQTKNTLFVVFDGDSLTAGANTSYGHDRPCGAMGALSTAPAVYPYSVAALGGQQTGAVLAAYPTRVRPLWSLYTGAKSYVLEVGTNDLVETSDSAATIFGRIQDIIALAVADGVQVAVHTNLPVGSDPTVEIRRQALLTLILNNDISHGGNYTVPKVSGLSLGQDPTIGVAGSQNNLTYYSSDMVHLTDAGTAIAQTYDQAFLNTLI
jgi:hypothetical protein